MGHSATAKTKNALKQKKWRNKLKKSITEDQKEKVRKENAARNKEFRKRMKEQAFTGKIVLENTTIAILNISAKIKKNNNKETTENSNTGNHNLGSYLLNIDNPPC